MLSSISAGTVDHHCISSAESSPLVSISIGALDDAEAVRPRIHQFCASRLSWFETKDLLPRIADNTLPHPDKRTSVVSSPIAHTILYVRDQEASMKFYSTVLTQKPRLHVPGMTEFLLNDGTILGLMPERGIKRLLGEHLPDPAQATGIPRAELYLQVQNPDEFHQRAIDQGSIELSPLAERDWGHVAAYSLDPDGHVLAFARPVEAHEVQSVVSVRELKDGKAEFASSVLRSLPNWFGIEQAIVDYVEAVKRLPTFVATVDNEDSGFLSVDYHNAWTAEIHVMAVKEQYHRKGVGRALVKVAEAHARKRGAEYMMVKTLGPSRSNAEYDRTREFYLSVGFRPLEEFKTIWDEHNPCLILVKRL